MRILTKLKNSTSGAAFTEYAILTTLVGAVAIFAVVEVGGEVRDNNTKIADILSSQVLSEMDEATNEGNSPTNETAPATPFSGMAVCAQATPWNFLSNNEYGGHLLAGQPIFAFWFGPNAPTLPATTTGGVPIIFTLPDTDGDGLIDEAEADTLTGYKWYVDTTTSEMAYHQGTINTVGSSNAMLFSDRTFTDADNDLVIDQGDQITPMLSTPSGWEIDPANVAPGVSCN